MEAREVFPNDCWQSIFNHLKDDGLEAASLVCKDLLEISNICKDSLEVVHPNVGMLSKLLKRFKHLKKINLRQFKGDDLDEAISEIVRSDTSLDVLGISDAEQFKAACLKDLDSNSKMKDLKALNYKGLHYLSATDLELIANSFPNLEQLKVGSYGFEILDIWDISGCDTYLPFPTVDGIEILTSKFKLLKKIHIAGYPICDQSLVALSKNCVFLKAVKISGIDHHVTENGIGHLLRNRPDLEALSIGFIRSSQSDVTIENSISHAKALTSLKFYEMDVSDMLLSGIASANLPLKIFGLKYCKEFTVSGLFMVLSKNNLSRLSICEADFIDADMERLLSVGVGKQLTHIDISNTFMTESMLFVLSVMCPSLVEITIDSSRTTITLDGNHVALSKNHKIRNLYLRNSGIGDECVKKLALIFPDLRVLELSYCTNVSSKGIEAILESCKFLRKLILKGSEINDEGLAIIAKKCPRLVSLNLDSCVKITPEGLKQIIINITTLKCLHIRSYRYGIVPFLEWMLSTGNFASLKKIYVARDNNFKYESKRDKFLEHGCLLYQR